MEIPQRQRLQQLVEELTTSGQPQLDQNKTRELKNICRASSDCIDQVYHLLMTQLNQDHAEIRLSAFQIVSELFSRSHHFRTLLVDNFQEFLELTVETDAEQPLPPPKDVARKLRSQAIQAVQSWHASYGSAYKKLALGYHFLKQVKKVDFQDAEARTITERRRQEERDQKMERIYKARVEAAAKEMEESVQDIEAALTQMEACTRLLFPDFGPADFQTASSSSSDSRPSEGEEPCCSKTLLEDRNLQEKTGGLEEEENRINKNRLKGEKGGDSWMTEQKEEEMDREDKQSEDGGAEDKRSEQQEKKGRKDYEREKSEMEKEEESSDEEEEEADEDSFIRNSGLISHSYSLDVSLSHALHVKETEDNEPVVSTMMELRRLLTSKHLPAVQNWVQVFTRSRAEPQLLRRALDLKKCLETALSKHRELHVDCEARSRRVIKASSDEEDDEDDGDFDEVPEKEGYEPHIPEHLRAEYGLDPSPSTSAAPERQRAPPTKRPVAPRPSCSSSSSRQLKQRMEEEQDPTCAAATLRLLREKVQLPPESCSSSSGPSSSRSSSEQKPAEAPVVSFGLDLYYWGQEQPNAGKIIKSASQHQFWVPAEVEEEVENDDLLAASRSRYISFPGRFVPVSHFCRAPLGNGKLCQRQDRVKCPFHGRIIPRNHEGQPIREEDKQREEQVERKRREQQPDWHDAELMRDIEAATGEDLGSDRVPGKKGKGKGKKKKYPNLRDLKQSSNTARSRLEKKVFNKSAVRRVAQVMSKADQRKHDKFSNQFNYALH